MKIINKIKNIMIFLLSFIVIGTSNIMDVKADENISSGIYQVSNSVYHENEIGMSMARSYLDEIMTVKITKDQVVYTIGFSGTDYMENYRVKINGVEVPIQIVEENPEAATIKLQVTTDSINNDLKACIYVGPMGRDVEFGIIPNFETMSLIETIEEPVEAQNTEIAENVEEISEGNKVEEQTETVEDSQEVSEEVNEEVKESTKEVITEEVNEEADSEEVKEETNDSVNVENNTEDKSNVALCIVSAVIVVVIIAVIVLKKRK